MIASRNGLGCLKRILRASMLALFLANLAVISKRFMKISSPFKVFTGDRNPSCDAIFHRDAYSPDNPLHPRNCYLKTYSSEDLVQCIGNLATAAKFIKNRDYFHIAFAGDSRIRQMYHSFSGMLPLYDANVTGHIHTRETVLQRDALVTSQVLQLKVTFLWRPYPDQDMQRTIDNWIEAGVQGAPDILVTGNLLWTMRRKKLVGNYSSQLQNVSRLLDALTKTTRVIWWDQDQLNERRYHHLGDRGAHADFNNNRIQELNRVARRALQNTKVLVWSSTHSLMSEYLRACAGFPVRKDLWRHWSCLDAIHPSFLYMHVYNQRLLNYLCNPFMDLGNDFCCYSNQETIFST